MPEPFSRRLNQRGAALLLFTLLIATVLLPMVGLAIDGGAAYYAHARLTAAVDAAALAGARSLSVGMDLASQETNASRIVTQYVQANFPVGMLNSSNQVIPQPGFTEANHVRTVSVSASMDIGLYFLGLLGKPTAHISVSASSSRRDVNIVVTLDRSGSMGGVCDVMKSDAENFVLKWTNGRDTMGLVTFMGNASTDYPSTLNFKSQIPSLTTVLAELQCGGNTGSAAAIYLAHHQILNVAEPGALNVIVFFTDGVPNGYTGQFPVVPGKTCGTSTTVDGYIADGGGLFSTAAQAVNVTVTPSVSIKGCTPGNWGTISQAFSGIPEMDDYGNSATLANYSPVLRNAQGKITFSDANSDAVSKNAALDAARQARNDGIVIYTIGLDGDGGVDNTLLEEIANDPSSPVFNPNQQVGTYHYSPNAGQLASIWNSIASEILRLSQ